MIQQVIDFRIREYSAYFYDAQEFINDPVYKTNTLEQQLENQYKARKRKEKEVAKKIKAKEEEKKRKAEEKKKKSRRKKE